MSVKCPKCQTDNPETAKFCSECATSLHIAEGISITKTIETPVKKLTKGTTFAGRYRIIEELGRGGMGVVYKAGDTKLKRTVALKFLPSELTHIPEIKERFMREAQAAAALDHPNICTVHELDEAEEKAFISMAYIEGQSLKKKIESGPLELDEAVRIALQVAEGLKEAHKKGVVHRDIKSANIMVDERDQAKIMDFGLARVAGSTLVTKEGMTMGTIAYMSPEQARGEEVDHRTDIWSFGVVMYEMFSGQLPFRGEQDQAVVFSILNEQPKPITDLNSDIPLTIEQVVGKALEKDRDKRYQQIDELIEDIKSIAEGIVPEEIRVRLRRAKLRMAEAMDSIAVLPLANISGNPEHEYIADGMTEALITKLAQIKALKVISRQSVMRYKGSDKPLPEIARELGVDVVIEGSMLWAGDRVRITAQLIEGTSDRHLWAKDYERDSHDILALHGEIAREISYEVKVAVTSEEESHLARSRRIDPEAYRLCLKSNFLLSRLSEEGYREAVECYKQALKIEPDYAASFAGLAMAYTELGSWHMASPEKGIQLKAKEAAMKAQELDDMLADAHFALGRIKFLFEWDWPATDRLYKKGIELNPSHSYARIAYANFLTAMGRINESIPITKQTIEIDPLLPMNYNELGYALQMAGNYDEALEQYQKALKLDPEFHQTHFLLAYNYFEKSMYEEAITHCQKLMSVAGELPFYAAICGYIYGMVDIRSEALEILDSLEERSKGENISSAVALIHIGLGEKDQALEWLDRAYKEHDIWLVWLKIWRAVDPLRDNPRFQDLLRRMNFPD